VNRRPMSSRAVAIAVALGWLNVGAGAEISENVVDRIRQAAPAAAPAEAARPRRVLVFTKTAGFRHDSIPVGVAALTVLGEKTGACAVTHTEDAGLFADAERLATFDAVCMLNTTGDVFTRDGSMDEAARRNL